MRRRTTVDIEGDAFLINARPTYPGRTFNGMKIEGLLLNSRMVQGMFDDLNPTTRPRWDYPDGPWDPDRNTRQFIAAMPAWRAHGLLGFTINLQGGSPQGYTPGGQPWINSAFDEEGELRDAYMSRTEKILDRADELGMAVILGYFYFGQDGRLGGEREVIRAVENATGWVLERKYANVLVEICNETGVHGYHHEILRPPRVCELLRMVQDRSRGRVDSARGRLLVGVSLGGRQIPSEDIVAASDLLLLHGNGVHEPDGIRDMVDETRASPAYSSQPIVFNEDDHFDFEKDDNNFLAAVGRYASWGYFDYRMEGEGFEQGYQSVPCDWSISSARKRGFFDLLARITGSKVERGAE